MSTWHLLVVMGLAGATIEQAYGIIERQRLTLYNDSVTTVQTCLKNYICKPSLVNQIEPGEAKNLFAPKITPRQPILHLVVGSTEAERVYTLEYKAKEGELLLKRDDVIEESMPFHEGPLISMGLDKDCRAYLIND